MKNARQHSFGKRDTPVLVASLSNSSPAFSRRRSGRIRHDPGCRRVRNPKLEIRSQRPWPEARRSSSEFPTRPPRTLVAVQPGSRVLCAFSDRPAWREDWRITDRSAAFSQTSRQTCSISATRGSHAKHRSLATHQSLAEQRSVTNDAMFGKVWACRPCDLCQRCGAPGAGETGRAAFPVRSFCPHRSASQLGQNDGGRMMNHRRSSVIISRVAAATASSQRSEPNWLQYGSRVCAKLIARELLISPPRPSARKAACTSAALPP